MFIVADRLRMSAVLGCILLWPHSNIASSDELLQDLWRRENRGDINVLCVYLMANGVECTYDELVETKARIPAKRRGSAAGIIDVARELGVRLSLISLRPSELTSCPLPMIVHIDGESLRKGTYLLLLEVWEDKIIYMNGPSATIAEMPRTAFTRVWSGYALLRRESQWREVFGALGGVGVGCLIISWFRVRSRKRGEDENAERASC